MTSEEFTKIFDKLTRNFRLPVAAPLTDAPKLRADIYADWFRQLQHFHVDAVRIGVDELMRTEKETFWPPVGRLIDLIQARIGRYDRQPGKCPTCHGSTWIDAPAYKANGQIYTALQRCPDCGTPAPKLELKSNCQPLTQVEAHEYASGRYRREQMPPGLEAKPKPEGERTEMREAMARLHTKLFGTRNAKGDLA